MVAILFGVLSWSSGLARANAQTFTSNDYAIDLFTGPVLGSGRIVGMAGAYSAIATGIDGSLLNPAGFAERAEHEINWWEWELTGGIWFGGLFSNNDFDNNGSSELGAADTLSLSFGGRLQYGQLGFGLSAIAQLYVLTGNEGSTDVTFANVRAGGGYEFARGDLVVGLAARVLTFELDGAGDDNATINFSGGGAEVGGLYRPGLRRYRVGAVFRTPISSKPDATEMMNDGVVSAEGLVLPERIHAPWEAVLGFAYQFGPRRSNVIWRHTSEIKKHLKRRIETHTYVAPGTYGGPYYRELPKDPGKALEVAVENDRESERRYLATQPRKYVLISTDFLLFGPTSKGQSVEAFLLQRREPSGRKVSIGVRAGMESELVPNWLKVRMGSYLEPARMESGSYRLHGTLGSDLRLFAIWGTTLRLTATADLAKRYFDWGAALGVWY
jgi:hypothetical protein